MTPCTLTCKASLTSPPSFERVSRAGVGGGRMAVCVGREERQECRRKKE